MDSLVNTQDLVKEKFDWEVPVEAVPIPSDGMVGQEIEDYFIDMVHEVDGLKIKTIKTVTEET